MTSKPEHQLDDFASISHSLADAVASNDLDEAKSLLERRERLLEQLARKRPEEVSSRMVNELSKSGERARTGLATGRENLREQLARARKAHHALEAFKPRDGRRGTSLDVAL